MGLNVNNILKSALSIIGSHTVKVRIATGVSVNDAGVPTVTYSEPIAVSGSVQPGIVSSFGGKNISEKDYKDMGLDWTRSYITVWIPDVGLKPIHDKKSSDTVEFNGRIFNVIQCADWELQNGWKRCYCAERKAGE